MNVIERLKLWLMPGDIPLAWRQLTCDKKRFATALAGVSFGVVIMLFQLGIFQAFMTMVIRPIVAIEGDLMLISPDFQYFATPGEFSERRLYQVLGDPDVNEIYPLAISYQQFSNPETGRKTEIVLMGVHASRNPFRISEVLSRQDILASPEAVLFDEDSTPDCGDIAGLLQKDGGVETEISGQRVRIGGLFYLGQTLGAYGHIISGMETYQRLSDEPSGILNMGLIRLKPEANIAETAVRLRAMLPEDVNVLSREELISLEQTYWQENTPVGFIVLSGMILAMMVGAVIVYQILYTDINDHIKEYATLKAIGLGQGFFIKFILTESLILLIIGFIPGMLICGLLFVLADSSAGLPARLTVSGTLIVFAMAALMCFVAGILATRRLRNVDPADIF